MTEKHVVCLAALLHDIGKFRQRTIKTPPYSPHEEYSRQFVEADFRGFFMVCGDDMAHAIAHHHRQSVERDIEKLVILADRLSANEREKEIRDQEEPSRAALTALLSRLLIAPQNTSEKRFHLSQLEWQKPELFFPTHEADVSPDAYNDLWKKFYEEFGKLAGNRHYEEADLTTIVALLRKYTSRMPSATPWEGQEKRTVPDISLYDHLKTTAAIAACLCRELSPPNLDSLMSALTAPRSGDGQLDEPLCALVKGDISGTQDFLYLLTSSGAARGLRGRSFYLQLLTETIAHWILRKLTLPTTNLLYAGGGHFYLLLPYRKTQEHIGELRREVVNKLWKAHKGDLSLTLACVPVTARDFLEGEEGDKAFAAKWGEVSHVVNEQKRRKWRDLDDETLMGELFSPHQRGTTAEEMCQVCHNEWVQEVDRLEDDVRKCLRCRSFEELGQKLRDPTHLVVFTVPEAPLPNCPAAWNEVLKAFGAEVRLVHDNEPLPPKPPDATAATVYTFDSTDFLTLDCFRWDDLPVSYDFRLLADATPIKGHDKDGKPLIADFSDLAEASMGAKWLGVLRMDVDSLGEVFKKGLGGQATISRMSTLSESLRLFFEGWVPKLCKQHNYFAQSGQDSVYLIYAGGDDLFVVGAWSALPELARQIRHGFREFVGGDHVTLSGGIAIEHAKFPLYQLAEDAKHALDDGAKEHKRTVNGREVKKDALCFLQKPMGWEQFEKIAKWKEELIKMLEPAGNVDALPSSFLTRLTEIHTLYADNATRQRRLKRGGANIPHIEEVIHYDKWQWRLIYQLSRFGERYTHFAEKVKALQHDVINCDLISGLHVLARWTALSVRKEPKT